MSSPNVTSFTSQNPKVVADGYEPGKLYRDTGGDFWVAIVDSAGTVGLIPLMDGEGTWCSNLSDIYKGSRYENVTPKAEEFYITVNGS